MASVMTSLRKAVVSRRSYEYVPIPSDLEITTSKNVLREPKARLGCRRLSRVTVAALVLGLFAYAWVVNTHLIDLEPCDRVGPDHDGNCTDAPWRYWGQYSPYFSVWREEGGSKHLYPEPGCKVTLVQGLYRHGARDPTAGKTLAYARTISRIKSNVQRFGGSCAFLANYTYSLGADQLNDYGREQMVVAGKQFYTRYQHLTKNTDPFLRAAGQKRVVDSAEEWAKGFHYSKAKDGESKNPDKYPYNILVISEDFGSNNTLGHSLCGAFRFWHGSLAQRIFAATFLPAIRSRLNKDLPGANLTDSETMYLMDLCPFETFSDRNRGKLSDFCSLFSHHEFLQYDYLQTLGKYYGYGDGNPYSSIQGAGFVNELISRFTGKPVDDHTSTNRTLDSDPATFPTGDEHVVFADFSHDNDMTAILSALGLYGTTSPLSNTSRTEPFEAGGYSASWTVPLAGRIYFEKIECEDEAEDFVRVLVNERVMDLKVCGGDKNSKCKLSAFVESMSWARSHDLLDRCVEEA